MNEKKVVAVIVEGPSDESALGGVLKEYFSSEEVQFKVVHGDITSSDHTQLDNAVNAIYDLIENLRSKYGYQWTDFAQIIHLADTDGVFTKNCVTEAAVDSIQYYVDHMESSNVEETIRRNTHKAQILFKLYATPKVNGIKYRIYFNSCNLEHVLYNELKDFSDEEKEQLSDDFSDRYEGKLDEFIDFISNSDVAVAGKYRETWKYIEKGTNSLQRHSNMHLIFDTERGDSVEESREIELNSETVMAMMEAEQIARNPDVRAYSVEEDFEKELEK